MENLLLELRFIRNKYGETCFERDFANLMIDVVQNKIESVSLDDFFNHAKNVDAKVFSLEELKTSLSKVKVIPTLV